MANAPPKKPELHHHVKRAILEYFGVDAGDVTTIGLAGVLLLVWKKVFAPQPTTGAVDIKGLIDEALWQSTLIFFQDAGKCVYKGGWHQLRRIGADGMPMLEGNGALIAEFAGGVNSVLRKTDSTLPAKLREYMFALLFSGTDATQKVTTWINGLVAEQGRLTSGADRWNQIARGDPTVKRFLEIARRVQSIIVRDKLSEGEWPKAYEEVALGLLANQELKLSVQEQAKRKFLHWLTVAKQVLNSPELADILAKIESWAREEREKLDHQNSWMGWAIIVLIVAIFALVLIGATMAPQKNTNTEIPTQETAE